MKTSDSATANSDISPLREAVVLLPGAIHVGPFPPLYHKIPVQKQTPWRSRNKGDIVGQTIGDLLIVGRAFRQMKGARVSYHLARCSCGDLRWYSTSRIAVRGTSACPRCNKIKGGAICREISVKKKLLTHQHGLFLARWSHIIRGAQSRNIPFTVSYDYVCELFEKQGGRCALSGLLICFDKSKKHFGSASLDRIDSELPYQEGNVQWVHKIINKMKQHYNNEAFILFSRFVTRHSQYDRLDMGGGVILPPYDHPRHPKAARLDISAF